MADTLPMQADGKDGEKGKPDGTNAVIPGSAGESGGGAQPGERHGRKDAGDPGYHGGKQLGGKMADGSQSGE